MATKNTTQDHDERTKIGGALDIRGDRGADDNDRATSGRAGARHCCTPR